MNKKYTIHDIAKLSGFSFKTVSRVINNEPNVKEGTREKIQKIIADTGYKPNLYARNMHSKSIQNILFSIRKTHGQTTTQWFDILMSYIMKSASSKPFTIIQEIIYNDGDLQHSMVEQSSGYIDALVLFYLEENDKRIRIAQDNHIPFISFEKNKQVPISISNNNLKGMQDAAQFLFGRGLTRVSLLLGAPIEVNMERELAIKAAYERNGIPVDRLEVVYHMNNFERIYDFVDSKIKKNQLPEVFFVSGDEKAIAVYNAIYRNGLSIPDDISVIGFDNIPMSPYYWPPLTTMSQDFEKLADELLDVIERILNKTSDTEEIPSTEVNPQLIIRESVK